jgi:predicted dienelactone hydrolase
MLAIGVAAADAAAWSASELRVGHTVKHIDVTGSAQGETRKVGVHLWYPAGVRGFADAPRTVYRSALYRRPLIDDRWDPLSWQVWAKVAREDVPIDPHGPALPVIVFSHGSTNDPIDYAHTLELIAGAGFVVAAPAHVNNTQDDARIDFINEEAARVGQPPLFKCSDGRPSPCSRTNLARSMQDRVSDITHTLDNLQRPDWLGERVDVSRVGVLGHSRGTVTALAAAGGSEEGTNGTPPWGFPAEARVDAVMGLAIGAPSVTFGADLADVKVPTLLVAGERDRNSAPQVSAAAFAAIDAAEKAYVPITNAVHRSFDSTYCEQLKSAAAITEAAGTNHYGEHKATLDWHTVRLIGTSFPGGVSGMAHEYCSADTFSDPDITGLMTAFNGLTFLNKETFTFDPGAPTTGLEADEVTHGVTELAVTFFGTVLKRVGNDGPHFTRFLAPRWLAKHEPMVGDASAFAGGDAICPPGQELACSD